MTATVTQCVVRLDDPAMALRILNGRSCLGWVLREFTRFGVSEFLLLTGAIPPDVPASLPRPAQITLSAPPPGCGSGGALFHVRDQLRHRFLVCDGSTPFDWNLAGLLSAAATDAAAVIGRCEAGNIGGIAVFRRELVNHLQPVCSLQADVLPDLFRRGSLLVAPDQNLTPEQNRLHPARTPSRAADRPEPGDIVVRLRRPALFLDRDGVLNLDHGYVGSRDRFEWTDGALDAIRYATGAGWHVFVVTNQSGVARGLYTEDAVRDLLDWMAGEAHAAGGTIDDVRFCPFHPEAALDAYRHAHPWRKPRPGMLLDLIRAWQLDPRRSVMVGDQATDMQAAAAAGVAGHLFRGGNLFDFLRPILDQHA
jgi:D,D-heptose 1,7-bisphosphate phosphatase